MNATHLAPRTQHGRISTVLRRGLGPLLAAALIPAFAGGPAAGATAPQHDSRVAAGQPSATPVLSPATDTAESTAAPQPLHTSSAYSGDLNSRITSFGRQIEPLSQRASALTAQRQSLDQRSAELDTALEALGTQSSAISNKFAAHNSKVDAHNAKVDAHNAKPHTFRIPAQAAEADAYSAEKAALDAEGAQLAGEENELNSEQDQLRTRLAELDKQLSSIDADTTAYNTKASALRNDVQQLALQRRQLLQQMAAVLQSLPVPPPAAADRPNAPSPAAASMARGGDAPRPTNATAGHATAPGGDTPARSAQAQALDTYGRLHDVKVDKRPVTAYLTPETIASASTSDTSQLNPSTTFDGLVPQPNGHYTALIAQAAGLGHSDGQNAFRSILANGGRATATVDGKKIVIDQVETAQDCRAAAGNAALPDTGSSSVVPATMRDGSRVRSASTAGQCGPTEDDAKAARSRASELQAQRPPPMNDRGTTAVIGVYNTATKTWTNRIAIEGGGPRPPDWKLRPGEEFVQARGTASRSVIHAEETIIDSLGPDEIIGFGGASRNICRDACYRALTGRGITFGGAGDFNGAPDKTPYSTFWSEGW
ncbi:hypothetical protein [Kitasatospora phosalacinea]|uniref:hypothetical protein n=1 Tax=Kitasatospora phosalacinea TaxID=2065 RepID=UPI000524130C|nr:hypothetical protein [Kitasatospora phosalacinea]